MHTDPRLGSVTSEDLALSTVNELWNDDPHSRVKVEELHPGTLKICVLTRVRRSHLGNTEMELRNCIISISSFSSLTIQKIFNSKALSNKNIKNPKINH